MTKVGGIMRNQPFPWSKRLVSIGLVLVAFWSPGMSRAGAADAWPEAGVGNIPATVGKLAVAFDGWGGDVLDPWQYLGTGLLQSYLNLRLIHRDENMQVVPLWATEWRQTPEGVFLTLDPKAKWQDGTPATAEDVKANIEALMGQYAPAFKGTPRLAHMKKVVEEGADISVRGGLA
jgi:ABC-type transport system substrate-binding protein